MKEIDIRSVILETGMRYLMPLMLIFAFYLLLRGHNAPGGGFVGGLVASAAFALHAIAYGVPIARKELGVNPRVFIGVGLLVAVCSGLIGLVSGHPFMTGLWFPNNEHPIPLPVIGKVGTPLMFDVGVCLLVIGVTLNIIFALFEEVQLGEEEF
jgi:multicomponent Na+:H+ antiporter subunit B